MIGLWSLIFITPRFPESYLQKLYLLWAPTSLLWELKVKATELGWGSWVIRSQCMESLCLQNRCGMGRSGVNLSPLLLEITFNSDPRGLRVANGEVIKPPDSEPFGVRGLSFSYMHWVYFWRANGGGQGGLGSLDENGNKMTGVGCIAVRWHG